MAHVPYVIVGIYASQPWSPRCVAVLPNTDAAERPGLARFVVPVCSSLVRLPHSRACLAGHHRCEHGEIATLSNRRGRRRRTVNFIMGHGANAIKRGRPHLRTD